MNVQQIKRVILLAVVAMVVGSLVFPDRKKASESRI